MTGICECPICTVTYCRLSNRSLKCRHAQNPRSHRPTRFNSTKQICWVELSRVGRCDLNSRVTYTSSYAQSLIANCSGKPLMHAPVYSRTHACTCTRARNEQKLAFGRWLLVKQNMTARQRNHIDKTQQTNYIYIYIYIYRCVIMRNRATLPAIYV